MKRLLAGLLLVLLAIPSVPLFAAPNITTTTKQQTISTQTLVSTTSPVPIAFNPAKTPNYFGQDLGPVTWNTAPSGFTWNVSKSDSMTMKNPVSIGPTAIQPNALVFYNSTHTALKLTAATNSLNIYFKPQKYSTKISIQASLTAPESVCIPFSASGLIVQQSFTNKTTQKITLLPSVRAGNEVFDWSDIKTLYAPSWNSIQSALCLSLPVGATNIDPIALDGSGHNGCAGASSCSVTLTTTKSPDVIILAIQDDCNVALCNPSSLVSVADTSSLSWTQRAVQQAHNGVSTLWGFEFCAIASGTLSSDSITATYTTYTNSFSTLVAFGVSGADTSGCAGGSYDSNGALPAKTQGTSTNLQTTYSTSNANDFILGIGVDSYAWVTITPIGSFNTIVIDKTVEAIATEYQVVSSTQSGASCGWTIDATNGWGIICDAIKQAAAATVTQPIKITTANGAPSATISISGCAVSNATFTANGNVKHYTSVTASCTVTLTAPTCAGGTAACYWFNGSPHPTEKSVDSFSTCAGPGTCSEHDNTTYYELKAKMDATAQSPTRWDGTYSQINMTETFLGVANHVNTCLPGGGKVTQGHTTDTVCAFGQSDKDYNTAFSLSRIGNTWFPQGNDSFIDTTSGGTHNVNYIQACSVAQPSTPTWLALLFFPGLILGVIIRKRR